MIDEIISFFRVLDWLHVQGPYVIESVFGLMLTASVLTAYAVMKIKRMGSKQTK